MRNEFQRPLNERLERVVRTPCVPSTNSVRTIRFKQSTICFETEDKSGYPQIMLISPKYTLSDGLQAGLSCGSLLIIIPLANCVCGRVYCLDVVRPTDRPSDRPCVSNVLFP